MVQFIDLWRGHPINESEAQPCRVRQASTGALGAGLAAEVPFTPDQSAIRLGIALHRAGISINDLGKIATCGVHPPSEMHILDAKELANVLARAELPGFGKVEVIAGDDVAKFYPRLFGRTGIIYIQDYWMRTGDAEGQPTGDHIDVWNGYRSSSKWLMEWFSWAGYYSNYAQAREIWFWDIK